MNPPASVWNNPPPPGTEGSLEEPGASIDESEHSQPEDTPAIHQGTDHIDPLLKNPQYTEHERRERRHRKYSRSRSRSKSKPVDKRPRDHDRKRRSRSRSRDRRRRSRSRGRNRRHHHSKSRSPSRTQMRHSKSRRDRRYRRSSSRGRTSHPRSRSRSNSRRSRHHSRSRRHRRSRSNLSDSLGERGDPFKEEVEEDEDDILAKENAFKNDGSFLEMFKKMQEEEQKKADEAAKEQASSSEIKKPLPAFGKRRGGRVLKTGMVQKPKILDETDEAQPQDAWSIYMNEVKRYKEACCDDDSKTRPLVK